MWISELYPTHGMEGHMVGLGAGRRVLIVRISRKRGVFVRLPFRVPM